MGESPRRAEDRSRGNGGSKTMKAKIIFQLLAPILLAIVSAAAAQQPSGKVPRIGILGSGASSDPRIKASLDMLRQGLSDFGYIEGKNIFFETRYGEGKIDRLPELADQLVRLKVDILFGSDTGAAQAAKKSTTTIPVVFMTGGNPVTSGLVASLARPGGNVTGVTNNSPELVGKRLGLLKEAVPKVSRFAFLMPADSTTIKAAFDDAKGTAKALGVQFQAVEVKAANPDLGARSDLWPRSALAVWSRKGLRESLFIESEFLNWPIKIASPRFTRGRNGRTTVGSCLTGRAEMNPIVAPRFSSIKSSRARSRRIFLWSSRPNLNL